jgi:hypothetical protein
MCDNLGLKSIHSSLNNQLNSFNFLEEHKSARKPTAALLFLNIQSPFLHHVVATGGGARSGVGPLHHPFPDL